MPVNDEQRLAILENQFDLQDYHFRNFFPHTDRRIVTRSGKKLGRIYIDRGPDLWRLIDISLLPEFTSGGIGGDLFDMMIAEADAAGVPIQLHCAINNRAIALYQRKGFATIELDDSGNWLMERSPASA